MVNNRNMFIASLLLLFLGTTPVYADGAGIEWDILNQEANDLSRQGECARAVVVAKEAIDVAVENVGWQHPDVATGLNNLALLYKTLGNYAKAEPLCKRALAIDEKSLGPDHPDVAIDLNNLAELYRATNRINLAVPLEQRAAQIRAIGR